MMVVMRVEVAFVTCLGSLVLTSCDANQHSPGFDETDSSGINDTGPSSSSESDDASSSTTATSSTTSSTDTSDDGDVPGCDGDGEATQPFGNHEFNYAPGTILPNHKTQNELDWDTTSFYDDWKQNFVRQGCGDGRYYVDAGISGKATVSEAHGYGMLIMAYMAGYDPQARTIFDGMFHYFQDHPSEGDARLLAWSQDPSCDSNDGVSSAADGDLDIAFALLVADKQWGSAGDINYAGEAGVVLAGIAQAETGDGYIQLGDWVGGGDSGEATRGSDFMPSHFVTFEAAVGNGNWGNVRSSTYDIFSSVQGQYASTTGLIPDFILNAASNPYPASPNWLEGPNDGQYSFNSCRVPWRVGLDFVLNGDSRSKETVQRITNWLRSNTGDSTSNITAGYSLDGDSLQGSNYTELAFVAPLGVAAMVDANNQGWLNDIWDEVIYYEGSSGYYGDTIAMIDLIIMSGNYWAPEDAPCG